MGHGQLTKTPNRSPSNNKPGFNGMDDWMFPSLSVATASKSIVTYVGVRGARQRSRRPSVKQSTLPGKPALVPVRGEPGRRAALLACSARRRGVPLHEVRRGPHLTGVGRGPSGTGMALMILGSLLPDGNRVGLIKAQHAVDDPVSPCAPTLLRQAGDARARSTAYLLARGIRAALVINECCVSARPSDRPVRPGVHPDASAAASLLFIAWTVERRCPASTHRRLHITAFSFLETSTCRHSSSIIAGAGISSASISAFLCPSVPVSPRSGSGNPRYTLVGVQPRVARHAQARLASSVGRHSSCIPRIRARLRAPCSCQVLAGPFHQRPRTE